MNKQLKEMFRCLLNTTSFVIIFMLLSAGIFHIQNTIGVSMSIGRVVMTLVFTAITSIKFAFNVNLED